MKKISAILLGTLIVSSAALASTNQVLSKNAVGYVKMTFPKGLSMANSVFEPMGAPIAISNTFASLPTGSKIHNWNGSSYVAYNKTLGGWGTAGTNVLRRGSAFWVEIPQAAASNSYTVFLMGEVPDSVTASNTVVAMGPGLNMRGFPYPVAEKWTNTQFAKSAPTGSKLHIWNGSSYVAYNKTLGGWGSATNVMIDAGQGFWVEYPSAAASTNLSIVKPYLWP